MIKKNLIIIENILYRFQESFLKSLDILSQNYRFYYSTQKRIVVKKIFAILTINVFLSLLAIKAAQTKKVGDRQ